MKNGIFWDYSLLWRNFTKSLCDTCSTDLQLHDTCPRAGCHMGRVQATTDQVCANTQHLYHPFTNHRSSIIDCILSNILLLSLSPRHQHQSLFTTAGNCSSLITHKIVSVQTNTYHYLQSLMLKLSHLNKICQLVDFILVKDKSGSTPLFCSTLQVPRPVVSRRRGTLTDPTN